MYDIRESLKNPPIQHLTDTSKKRVEVYSQYGVNVENNVLVRNIQQEGMPYRGRIKAKPPRQWPDDSDIASQPSVVGRNLKQASNLQLIKIGPIL